MEALFQIVGCVVSSKPAAKRIDDFVAQLRRERAVVMVKDAQRATFVRFNAPDATLVTLAREAVLGKVPSSLRFGFAAGIKETTLAGQDGLSISNRSIAQASDLAAAASNGEVLVSPQLALLLIESGFALHSKKIHLPDGRVVAACSLELSTGAADPAGAVEQPLKDGGASAALGSVYQTLMAQAGEVARKQADLDARLDAALSKMAVPAGDRPAGHSGALDSELDSQLMRLKERLRFIDELEQRVNTVHATASDVERRLAELLARRAEIESLKNVYDTLATQAVDAQQKLDGVAAAQARLLPLASQVATLQQSLQDSQRSVAAFEGRLSDLDRGAETVEHKIRALADREALVQAVTAEVENIRQISSRSKADLQFVAEHRDDVTELRAKVEQLLGRMGDTDGQIALIESRRKTVEEVQSRANTITNMLGDINVNLEMLSEQRAVIDHVGEKVARLDFTVQEAQNTLRALQREREVAERIEQGIKALRSRSSTNKFS
jgi:hypothetical protein